jgi:predicted RNA binding protein YcfA (HicA-like mRNA interferase family)
MPKRRRPLSGAQVVRARQRLGFERKRQHGSHVILRKGQVGCVVPMHDELATGTLRGILSQAGSTLDDLEGALKA